VKTLLIVVACLTVTATPAHATCDGCCDIRATLAGWSEDGETIAVIETIDGEEQVLAVGSRRWSAFAGDEPACVDPARRLPGRAARDARRIDVETWRPLRRYRLEAVDRFWSLDFLATYQAVAVGVRRLAAPFDLGVDGLVCDAWEIRDLDGGVVATLPRRCDIADRGSIDHVDVLGGFVHPSADVLLIKVRIHRMRLETEERFLRVEL
jgi:hypothetical protein